MFFCVYVRSLLPVLGFMFPLNGSVRKIFVVHYVHVNYALSHNLVFYHMW